MSLPKPRVYWEDAPPEHDPEDSCWFSHVHYPSGVSVKQGHDSWRKAFTWAWLQAVEREVWA